MRTKILVAVLAAAICAASVRAETNAPAAAPASPVDLGKSIVEKKKCSICHMIDGKGGKTGKSLNGIAEGKTDDFLKGALLDPKKTIAADTKMPAYKFTDEELKGVIEYIKSLKATEKPKS